MLSSIRLSPRVDRIILGKLQADTIHTVPLVRRCRIALSFEDMAQVPTAIATHDFRPLHAESAVRVSRHRTWDGIKICRPAAA